MPHMSSIPPGQIELLHSHTVWLWCFLLVCDCRERVYALNQCNNRVKSQYLRSGHVSKMILSRALTSLCLVELGDGGSGVSVSCLRGVIRGTAASHSHPLYSTPTTGGECSHSLSLLNTHTQNSELLEAHRCVNLVSDLTNQYIHT